MKYKFDLGADCGIEVTDEGHCSNYGSPNYCEGLHIFRYHGYF